MSLTVSNPARALSIGGSNIPFPDSTITLTDFIQSIMGQYPMLRGTTVLESDGTMVNGVLTYPVHIPPVKTNG